MSTPESSQPDLDDTASAEAKATSGTNGGGMRASIRVAGLVALSTVAVVVLGKLAQLLVGPRP